MCKISIGLNEKKTQFDENQFDFVEQTLSVQNPLLSSPSKRIFPLLQVVVSGQSHRFIVSLKIKRSGQRNLTSISAKH